MLERVSQVDLVLSVGLDGLVSDLQRFARMGTASAGLYTKPFHMCAGGGTWVPVHKHFTS